jgi:hypothetical protein
MTPCQQLEFKRLTPLMKDILRYVEVQDDPEIISIGGRMRSVSILVRRGFLTSQKTGNGWRAVNLTAAGREALAIMNSASSK